MKKRDHTSLAPGYNNFHSVPLLYLCFIFLLFCFSNFFMSPRFKCFQKFEVYFFKRYTIYIYTYIYSNLADPETIKCDLKILINAFYIFSYINKYEILLSFKCQKNSIYLASHIYRAINWRHILQIIHFVYIVINYTHVIIHVIIHMRLSKLVLSSRRMLGTARTV